MITFKFLTIIFVVGYCICTSNITKTFIESDEVCENKLVIFNQLTYQNFITSFNNFVILWSSVIARAWQVRTSVKSEKMLSINFKDQALQVICACLIQIYITKIDSAKYIFPDNYVVFFSSFVIVSIMLYKKSIKLNAYLSFLFLISQLFQLYQSGCFDTEIVYKYIPYLVLILQSTGKIYQMIEIFHNESTGDLSYVYIIMDIFCNCLSFYCVIIHHLNIGMLIVKVTLLALGGLLAFEYNVFNMEEEKKTQLLKDSSNENYRRMYDQYMHKGAEGNQDEAKKYK